MIASTVFVLAVAAAADPAVAPDIRACRDPLWITLTDQRGPLPIERDFSGCGDGALEIDLPEGVALDVDGLERERVRYSDLDARAEGGRVTLRFRPRTAPRPIEAKLDFERLMVLDDGRYTARARRARGGPFVRIHAHKLPVRDVAEALARHTGTRLVGAGHLAAERITLDWSRVPVRSAWEVIGDAGSVYVAYWPERGIVRAWRTAEPARGRDAEDDPARMALPDLAQVGAAADEAGRACATGERERCIAGHEAVLARLPPAGPVGAYLGLTASIALLKAYHAAGAAEDVRRIDRQLAAAVRAGDPRGDLASLETLRDVLDIDPAAQTADALLASLQQQLADAPAQPSRLPHLALAAMRLERTAAAPRAGVRLRQLANDYFDIEYDAQLEDVFAYETGGFDLTLARVALGRVGEAVAIAATTRGDAGTAKFALFMAGIGARDDPAAVARVDALRTRVQALLPEAVPVGEPR